MTSKDTSLPMSPDEKKLLQQVCGTFLYYARAVDCTMLHTLNYQATRVKNGKKQTVKAIKHFLDYFGTNSEATVLYQVSDMILHDHSDAAYLVVAGARSRLEGYTFLGNEDEKAQINNSLISIIAKLIKHVMASAAEVDIAALFMNARYLLPLRTTCAELGNPQPATLIS